MNKSHQLLRRGRGTDEAAFAKLFVEALVLSRQPFAFLKVC
jgi:hypothetical protein